MKQFIFLFGFAMFLNACGGGGNSAPAVGASIDLSGFEIQDIPGTNFQKVVKRTSDGTLLEEGVIMDGKRNGMWVTYHTDNEIPKTIVNYVNDVSSGSYYSFNNRGQLEEMRGYLNNELDGKWGKYKFGRTTEEANYKNGKFDGVYKSYFANSDKVQKEFNYKNGELHGNYKFYNEDGQVTLEYEYDNGEKVSGGIVEPASSN
jgi:antitoxin component YwqK of YwqJK toxin-antitoxin module